MLAFRTSALNFREPRTEPVAYRRLAWYLDVPHGVQKQSCWLSACERSASVPESAVCNKRGSRRACRRYNYHCRQPAHCAREDAAAARELQTLIISSSAGQDYKQQHGWTPWRRQRRGPRRPRRLRPRQRRPRARPGPRARPRTRRRRQGRVDPGTCPCRNKNRRDGRSPVDFHLLISPQVTKLGRLVKEGRIRSLEEIFLHSMFGPESTSNFQLRPFNIRPPPLLVPTLFLYCFFRIQAYQGAPNCRPLLPPGS